MKSAFKGLLCVMVGTMLAMAVPLAAAHHSSAMFDTKQRTTLTGTVREFQWTSPHCYVQLLVKGKNGEEEWSLEMGAPMYLYRHGWRPASLQAGDQVTVEIAPLRSGEKGGLLLEATTADGNKIGKKP